MTHTTDHDHAVQLTRAPLLPGPFTLSACDSSSMLPERRGNSQVGTGRGPDPGRSRKQQPGQGFDAWPGGTHPKLAAASIRGTTPGQGPALVIGRTGDGNDFLRYTASLTPAPLNKGLSSCPGEKACDVTLRSAASARPHVPGAQTSRRLGLCHLVRKASCGHCQALWTVLVRSSVSIWSIPELQE